MSIYPILGRTILVATVLNLIGCSEMQRPPMNSTQADSYNQCMSTHWSSLADSVLFGVPGYMYHQNAVLSCQQVALATQAPTSFDQPIKPASALAVAPATAAPAAATANPGMPVGAGSPGNEWQPAR
jgi:hypothetical protein